MRALQGKPAMDVKEAVSFAKHYVNDLFAEEGLSDLGLEEVEFDDVGNAWRITLGFSRPWTSAASLDPLATMAFVRERNYKVVTILDDDGRVLSLRNWQRTDD